MPFFVIGSNAVRASRFDMFPTEFCYLALAHGRFYGENDGGRYFPVELDSRSNQPSIVAH